MHLCVIMYIVDLVSFLPLSVIIYIFWQVSQGRKELIVLLRQQIVNVSVFGKIWFFFVTFVSDFYASVFLSFLLSTGG